MHPGLALAISAAVALLSWRLKALAGSGAIAATLVGLAVLVPLGWPGLLILGTFFVSSTLVARMSAMARDDRDELARETRNARQVLANGGFAALGALADFATPGLGLWLATIGFAAAGGDTWATGLGSMSPRPPRDILTWRRVQPGRSGGVTWFGSSGGILGAALVALAASTVGAPPRLFLAATLTGGGAMLLDSALGSALQARFRCEACGEDTEQATHRCGGRTTPVLGVRWLDNDMVNAVASGCAVLVGWALW